MSKQSADSSGQSTRCAALQHIKATAWFRANCLNDMVKAVVGIRGSNKTAVMNMMLRELRRITPDTDIIIVDFADAAARHLKTPAAVMEYLGGAGASKKRRHLVLHELGLLFNHGELLRKLMQSGRWNIWLSASNAHVISEEALGSLCSKVVSFRVWTDANEVRSPEVLRGIWGTIFMRDVISGRVYSDIRAKELLAEYYSDHLGDAVSAREVSAELTVNGRRLSANTISAYRAALENAFLIERSEIYNVFEHCVVKAGGRVFFTDLELRNWRFGASPEGEERRLALNRAYIHLRRRYEKVYTPCDYDADFVTFESNGSHQFWQADYASTVRSTMKMKPLRRNRI